MEKLESIAEFRLLTEAERISWRDDKKKIMELEQLKKLDMQQMAKIKWATDGDENTRFFHGTLKQKSRKNRIHGLNINGEWISDPMAIKSEVYKFFADKFHERWTHRPKFINHNFKQLSNDQSSFLELEFSDQEIKNAVWCCGGKRRPDMIGIPSRF